jgi:hypothetical protein
MRCHVQEIPNVYLRQRGDPGKLRFTEERRHPDDPEIARRLAMAVTGGSTQRIGLEREFDYYLEHQDELVERYDGRVIVIKDGEVLGDYDSHIDAVTETKKTHEMGTFLVQAVSPGAGAYTQRFHSRVMRL